jgi:PAS domain S-box-containing protein
MADEQIGAPDPRFGQADRDSLTAIRSVERLFSGVSSYAAFSFDRDGLILTWNPGVESILGYASDQFVGRAFSELFTEHDRRRGVPQEEMATAARHGESANDRWHVRRDGSTVFVAGVVMPLRDDRGGLHGFTKLVRDRTEVRESAIRLRRRRDRAEAANREKDAFVALLAHELRQPLTAMLGWAQLGATGRLAYHRTHEVFARIRRSADATLRFVEDLLDMSRIGSGKLQLAIQRTDLRAIVQETVAELMPTAEERGVSIDVDADHLCIVDADPVRVRQAVANLVGNAVKYTPRGGSVRVTLSGEGTQAVISVSDTGVGIAADDLPVIFERFRQSRAADQKQSGLGLGLWVTKQVVDRHGGTIQASSDGPGNGATFVVCLPRRQGSPASAVSDRSG